MVEAVSGQFDILPSGIATKSKDQDIVADGAHDCHEANKTLCNGFDQKIRALEELIEFIIPWN